MSESIFDRPAETFCLLRAHPHERGPGKVHVLRDDNKTRCGKRESDCPGLLDYGYLDQVDCKGCLSGLAVDRRRAEEQREWAERQAERQAEREQETRDWWESYDRYLESPGWRHRRQLVLQRAGGLCEGCRERPATQVHHTTYRTYNRAGREMCFELVAICDDCHRLIHEAA